MARWERWTLTSEGGFGRADLISDSPGQKFGDPTDRMISNAPNDEPQIRLWIDAIEFGRADQAIDGCGAFAAGIRTGKQEVFPPQRHGSQRTFRRIVIDLDPAIACVKDERRPKFQGITNRLSQC